MECRSHCGACCIAPSISSSIPGMPQGKPAGVRCVQLDEENHCRIFTSPLRPAVCAGLQPHKDMCANSREEALIYLLDLDAATAPYSLTPS
ncbi:YkgJ family cysteine cluster protein [Rosenbergiella australiborealis]|uniref:YkgJ family cysteine cluster protein n=1 Tax=Rosenbergiella australiborealis TaxID=1544696 RepID=UPI001F4E5541|nr:YkgJ family cysteine cluster protein [Rosenbergiella australiborealis]